MSWLDSAMSWIGEVVTDVTDTIGQTGWTDVLSTSVTTSIVGAGVGALASAITDGDITEGLLYGATGGLVAGGLMEFGSQFASNWQLSDTMSLGDVTLGGSTESYSITNSGVSLFEDGDQSIAEQFGVNLGSSAAVDAALETQVASMKPTTDWWSKAGDFLSTEGGAGLALGGVKFIGDLLDDSDTAIDIQNRQLDMIQQSKDDQKTALGGFSVTAQPYTPSTSVPDVIRSRGVANDKTEQGVNLGGNTSV